MGLLQNLPSPAFSFTLTLLATTSPLILSPVLENRGVWLKARKMGMVLSSVTVVAPLSNPQVHGERRGKLQTLGKHRRNTERHRGLPQGATA